MSTLPRLDSSQDRIIQYASRSSQLATFIWVEDLGYYVEMGRDTWALKKFLSRVR